MKHVILIGYKSVGKSAIGAALAHESRIDFVDLDDVVEEIYKESTGLDRNCRQIMLTLGQTAFREIEHKALGRVLRNPNSSVISLGGGTPLLLQNKLLLKNHTVVQVTAPKNIVFERIMINGKPAFFSDTEHPLTSFNKTWEDRSVVYEALTNLRINNAGSLAEAVSSIKEKIKST